MTVLHRFTKPGDVAVICERKVPQWRAIEFLVHVDHDLIQRQTFHGDGLAEYRAALASQIAKLVEGGWIELFPDLPPSD